MLLIAYPALLKAIRARRRRDWAKRSGAKQRVAVAYAEFRDLARDLGIGNPVSTPVEFMDHFIADPEHVELAWLKKTVFRVFQRVREPSLDRRSGSRWR